jgi:hypothetical protein
MEDETMAEIGHLIPASIRGPFPGEDGWGRDNWRNPTYDAEYTCGHRLSLDHDHFPDDCLICTGKWSKNAASNFLNVQGKEYRIFLTLEQLRVLVDRSTGYPEIDAQIRRQLEHAEAEWAMWGSGNE